MAKRIAAKAEICLDSTMPVDIRYLIHEDNAIIERFPTMMPQFALFAPLYPEPPYLYKAARVVVAFLDNPPATMPEGLLPTGLVASPTPMQVTIFADYPDSTIASYKEAVILVGATYNDTPVLYCPLIYVTSDTALCAGREIWGFPKKLASIDIEIGDHGFVHCRLARKGEDLLLMEGTAPNEIDASSLVSLNSLAIINHKVIPGVAGGQPDVDLLTAIHSKQSVKSAFGGTGTLKVAGESAQVLGTGGTVQLLWSLSDLILPAGEVIEGTKPGAA